LKGDHSSTSEAEGKYDFANKKEQSKRGRTCPFGDLKEFVTIFSIAFTTEKERTPDDQVGKSAQPKLLGSL